MINKKEGKKEEKKQRNKKKDRQIMITQHSQYTQKKNIEKYEYHERKNEITYLCKEKKIQIEDRSHSIHSTQTLVKFVVKPITKKLFISKVIEVNKVKFYLQWLHTAL